MRCLFLIEWFRIVEINKLDRKSDSVIEKAISDIFENETDVKNNEIGRQIVVQNPNKTLNEYMKLVENNINSKNYYNAKSQYVKNLK